MWSPAGRRRRRRKVCPCCTETARIDFFKKVKGNVVLIFRFRIFDPSRLEYK